MNPSPYVTRFGTDDSLPTCSDHYTALTGGSGSSSSSSSTSSQVTNDVAAADVKVTDTASTADNNSNNNSLMSFMRRMEQGPYMYVEKYEVWQTLIWRYF